MPTRHHKQSQKIWYTGNSIDVISSKDNDEERVMHSKSDNIEIHN